MKKLLSVVVLLTLLLGVAPSGFADKKLTSYTLLVNAEPVSLSSSTGYIAKTSNGRLMLPLKKICQELGLETKMNGKKKQWRKLRSAFAHGSTMVVRVVVTACRVRLG